MVKRSEGKANSKRGQSKGKAKAKRRQSQVAPETAKDESPKQPEPDILDHLGPCWGHIGTSSGDLGRFWGFVGAPNLTFLGNFGGHFLDQFLKIFWTTLGVILGIHFGSRLAQEGPRWAQERHLELRITKKLH